MLGGFLGHVPDKCIADLKAGICTLALPSCGAKCTGRVACRSECKAIHASCGSFVSKDTLGPIQPGGAMEGIVKGMVGDDEMFSASARRRRGARGARRVRGHRARRFGGNAGVGGRPATKGPRPSRPLRRRNPRRGSSRNPPSQRTTSRRTSSG